MKFIVNPKPFPLCGQITDLANELNNQHCARRIAHTPRTPAPKDESNQDSRAARSTLLLRMDTHAYSMVPATATAPAIQISCRSATPPFCWPPTRTPARRRLAASANQKSLLFPKKFRIFAQKGAAWTLGLWARKEKVLFGSRMWDVGCRESCSWIWIWNSKSPHPGLQSCRKPLENTLQFGGRPSMSMSCCWTLAKNALANVAGCRLPVSSPSQSRRQNFSGLANEMKAPRSPCPIILRPCSLRKNEKDAENRTRRVRRST